MGNYQERKFAIRSQKAKKIKAEYLFNPIEIQQVNQKDHLDQLLDRMSLMDDFEGDHKDLRMIFDHLHNKGIDCEEILTYLDRHNRISWLLLPKREHQ